MTAEEQQMLQGLVDRINQTRLDEKDPDAEQFIRETLGRNPDALYVMAQTVLVQGYALEQAQKQIADLRAQLSQAQQHAAEPRHATSFLGSLLGRQDEPKPGAPPPPPPPPPVQPYGTPGYGPGLAYPAGGYPIAGAPVTQGSGFLQSAMQTAAGVAAGALAFEGIESLMHGFGHAAGYGTEFVGPGFGNAGFGGAPREEIVNNYYGDASPREHGGDFGSGGEGRHEVISDHPEHSDHATDSSQFSSASDTNGGGNLHDASYVTSGGDQSGDDATNADDLSGTGSSDCSAQGDDSMLSDDVGDQDSGGFDSGGDFGGDSSGDVGSF
jgi:hypothetical protein